MSTLRARYVLGNLLWYQPPARPFQAIGPTAVTWELRRQDLQNFGIAGTDPRGYVTTMVETGIGTSEVEASDEIGFVAELVTDSLENDGINLQRVGEAFQCSSGREVYFGCALQVSEATQSDFFVGLSITTTNALGGVTDSVRFQKLDGSTALSAVTEKNSTETLTASVATIANDVTTTMEFYVASGVARFYVNSALVATHTTNLPDDEALSPVLHFLSGANGVQRMKVAWARALALG